MRKFLVLVVLLLSLFTIAGCDKEQAKDVAKPTTKIQNVQQSFVVYRAAADGSEVLLPEKFSISDNGKSPIKNALQYLVATKPGDAKYTDVVPIGTKVLGLKVENGTAFADFSKEIVKKGQGSYNEMMLCYAIVNTLTEFPEVKRVQILVEGKKVVSLGGHMDVEEPLTRNASLLAANNK